MKQILKKIKLILVALILGSIIIGGVHFLKMGPIERIEMFMDIKTKIQKSKPIEVEYTIPLFDEKTEYKDIEGKVYSKVAPIGGLKEYFSDIPMDLYSKEEDSEGVLISDLIENGFGIKAISSGLEYLLAYRKYNEKDIISGSSYNVIDMYMLRFYVSDHKMEASIDGDKENEITTDVYVCMDYNKRVFYDVKTSEIYMKEGLGGLELVDYLNYSWEVKKNEGVSIAFAGDDGAKTVLDDYGSKWYREFQLKPMTWEGEYKKIVGYYRLKSGEPISKMRMNVRFELD